MRGAPQVGFSNHLEDQLPHFLRGLFSSGGLPNLGNQLPIRPEAGPVPADHRFRGDDDERLLPTGPDSPSKYPEEPVKGAKARPWMPPLQHGELLPKCEVFQNEIPTALKSLDERPEQEQKECEHGPELYQIKATDVAVSR